MLGFLHALAAGCPGCTNKGLFMPFTIDYLGIYAVGFFSSFLKLYVSALIASKK
jgi:hypothetical protein